MTEKTTKSWQKFLKPVAGGLVALVESVVGAIVDKATKGGKDGDK